MSIQAHGTVKRFGWSIVVASGLALSAACAPPSAADEMPSEHTDSVSSASTSYTAWACITDRASGANGEGHVGFAVETASGVYTYGSLEDPTGAISIANGSFNGGWYATGTWAQMIAAFGSTHHFSNGDTSPPYGAIECRTVSNANPSAAITVAKAVPGRGYGVIGNNCENAAWDVLHAFNATTEILQGGNSIPNNWWCSMDKSGDYYDLTVMTSDYHHC